MEIHWTSMESGWKINENQRTFMKNWLFVFEKWLIVFEMWLTFRFWDVNCHSKPKFEWWMIKLNEPLMNNSPQSSSCFESRFDLPRMQQWCNTSRRQYIVTSHLKNAWNKFVQWFNAFIKHHTGAWSLQIQCKSKIPDPLGDRSAWPVRWPPDLTHWVTSRPDPLDDLPTWPIRWPPDLTH